MHDDWGRASAALDAMVQDFAEGETIDPGHGQVRDPALDAEFVDREKGGAVQVRATLGLAMEASQSLRVGFVFVGEQLECDQLDDRLDLDGFPNLTLASPRQGRDQ